MGIVLAVLLAVAPGVAFAQSAARQYYGSNVIHTSTTFIVDLFGTQPSQNPLQTASPYHDNWVAASNVNVTFQSSATFNVVFGTGYTPTAPSQYYVYQHGVNRRSDGGVLFTYNLPTAPTGLRWETPTWVQSGLIYTSLGSVPGSQVLANTQSGGLVLRLVNDSLLTQNQVGFTVNNGSAPERPDRGDLATSGSHGRYSSNVLDISNVSNLNGFSAGYTDVMGTYPTPATDAPFIVLLDLERTGGLSQSQLQTFLQSLSTFTGSSSLQTVYAAGTSTFNHLVSISASPARDWDVALQFALPANASAGNLDFSWNFAADPSIFVQAMTSVYPEPTLLAPVATIWMLLMRRPNRSRREAA